MPTLLFILTSSRRVINAKKPVTDPWYRIRFYKGFYESIINEIFVTMFNNQFRKIYIVKVFTKRFLEKFK